MKTIPGRIVVYLKDVMNITGRRERTATKLLARIRKHLGKPVGSIITVEDCCLFTGLREEKIIPFLR